MKIYSILNERDEAGAAGLAEYCRRVGATGLTLFSHEAVVAPDPEALAEVQSSIDDESALIANAVKDEDFDLAARRKDRKALLESNLDALRRSGMDWLKSALGDIWDITHVFVMQPQDYPDAKSFPPTVGEFLKHVAGISEKLCSVGLHGTVHKTPLQQRVFVPVSAVAGIVEGEAGLNRYLANLPPLSQLGKATLGDLGGSVTAKEVDQQAFGTRPVWEKEAFHDPNLVSSLIPAAVKDLNSDETRVAEKLLEGLAIARAANACGVSWQSVGKTLKPSIVAKFAAAGLDFDKLWDAAKAARSEASDEK